MECVFYGHVQIAKTIPEMFSHIEVVGKLKFLVCNFQCRQVIQRETFHPHLSGLAKFFSTQIHSIFYLLDKFV